MRVLITGTGGMLAHALVPELRGRGHETIALTRAELDVTDPTAVERALDRHLPDVVVQCAAFTAVDAAEERVEEAFAVNEEGTRNVARACQTHGTLLVYPSSDYVFAGSGERPYSPDDPIEPVNAYGRSKAAGETAAMEAGRALVVRTSWLYGAGGRNFVDTILGLARERDVLQVVNDQWGRPTWTGTLAACLAELAERGATGVLHCTDGGEPVTWHGLAVEALKAEGLTTVVEPVSSGAFPRPADRPEYSVLDCSGTEALLGRPLPDWRATLRRHLGRPSRGHEMPRQT